MALAQRGDDSCQRVSTISLDSSHHGLCLCVRTFRGVIIASVTACILPLINAIGVAATGAIFAGVAWIGFGCVASSLSTALTLTHLS